MFFLAGLFLLTSVNTANVVTKYGCTHSFQTVRTVSRPAQLILTSTPPTQFGSKIVDERTDHGSDAADGSIDDGDKITAISCPSSGSLVPHT
jgi:hypothetical protein